KLAGCGFGLYARDQLSARRAHHLDRDEREALVERLDGLLFDLGEVCRVIDEAAFFLGGLDQFVAAEILRRNRSRAERGRRKSCRCARGELPAIDPRVLHWRFSLLVFYPARPTE